ncbi:MAG: hypothetical protein ONB44_10205 [candidate division KSB1 bacterium]|nr:hypothetical protein [candidate division KSB1 bacterium]MDZ7302496.1 hypothetical protein [candidate division KSB1 bacterium]MDZ7311908.1 hypothetical protein [candidate division KSB1 bacterium]
MNEHSNKAEQPRQRVVMSRVVTREQHGERSFDIEFWQKVGAQGRFAAAWQMVREVQLIRGKSGELPRMQKSVVRIIRRSEIETSDQPSTN